MSVAGILKEKGRNVSSVLPARSLNETITVLAGNRIGAVVVADEAHHILGIISERDIVRIIAKQGAAALVEPVAQHMTKPVITCSEHHNIDWVMGEMTAHRFRHMPVSEQGLLAGIVSIGDVVKFKLAKAVAETEHMRQYFAAG